MDDDTLVIVEPDVLFKEPESPPYTIYPASAGYILIPPTPFINFNALTVSTILFISSAENELGLDCPSLKRGIGLLSIITLVLGHIVFYAHKTPSLEIVQ